ncbi:hypothetical protein BOX15_Mlig012188g1, partial [Macrostomum lignano]
SSNGRNKQSSADFNRSAFHRSSPPSSKKLGQTAMDEELVSEGARLRLSCRITGRPPPRVSWLFNGRPMDGRRAKFGTDSDPERGEFWLDLPAVRRGDAGVYSVVAENCEGRVESRCHVRVAATYDTSGGGHPAPSRGSPLASPTPFAPRFSGSFSEQLDVQVGDKVTFICTVHGYPRPQVAWHKDGARLHSNNFVMICSELSESGDEHKLLMQHVTLDHAGLYKVEAWNPIGSTECQCLVRVSESNEIYQPKKPEQQWQPVVLSAVRRASIDSEHGVVNGNACETQADETDNEELRRRQQRVQWQQLKRQSPPEFSRLFRDEFCRPGDRMSLECEISAWPEPEVTWSFRGQPIRADDSRFEVYQRGQTHRLLVHRVTVAEAGRYSVTAENDSGIATCSGLLIVQGSDTIDSSRIVAAVGQGASGSAKTEWVIFHRGVRNGGASSRPGSVHSAGSGYWSGNDRMVNGTAVHSRPWRP